MAIVTAVKEAFKVSEKTVYSVCLDSVKLFRVLILPDSNKMPYLVGTDGPVKMEGIKYGEFYLTTMETAKQDIAGSIK